MTSFGNTDASTIENEEKSCLTAREKKIRNSNIETDQFWKGGNGTKSEEWQTVPSHLITLKQSLNYDFNNSISTPINFTEAWSFFQTCDMSSFKKLQDPVRPLNKIQRSISMFMGCRKLKRSLTAERDLIFAVANCPMNNDIVVYRRILQSIYVFMTKNSSCPRYGNHWEEVGFQGQDPASDLRGVGMFGALQMLYLSCAPETKDSLSPDIYELSRNPSNQFPLAVLSLNVTKMALDAFRDGLLNKYCNKSEEVVMTVNRFYLCILYRIYKKWKENNLTIHDSCYLLKDVEKRSRTHPGRSLQRLDEYLAQNSTCNGIKKRKWLSKKSDIIEDESRSLSWLDLTKPSLEVFI